MTPKKLRALMNNPDSAPRSSPAKRLAFLPASLRGPEGPHYPYGRCTDSGTPLARFQSSWIPWWVLGGARLSDVHTKGAEKGEALAAEVRALLTSAAKAEFRGTLKCTAKAVLHPDTPTQNRSE